VLTRRREAAFKIGRMAKICGFYIINSEVMLIMSHYKCSFENIFCAEGSCSVFSIVVKQGLDAWNSLVKSEVWEKGVNPDGTN